MAMRPLDERGIAFTINGSTYEIPPVGYDAGIALTQILDDKQTQESTGYVAMFELAVTPELWEQMRADGVGLSTMWRVGLAATAHFTMLSTVTGPDRFDLAERAAEAIWESGIDPKDLAAFLEAKIQAGQAGTASTRRSTRTAAASTTPTRASGTGTTSRKTGSKASRSRGAGGRTAGTRS